MVECAPHAVDAVGQRVQYGLQRAHDRNVKNHRKRKIALIVAGSTAVATAAIDDKRAAEGGVGRRRSRGACSFARIYLRITDANSETMKTSAIWDFGTADGVSDIFVMLSRNELAACLAASAAGRAGGPTKIVHLATYSETDC